MGQHGTDGLLMFAHANGMEWRCKYRHFGHIEVKGKLKDRDRRFDYVWKNWVQKGTPIGNTIRTEGFRRAGAKEWIVEQDTEKLLWDFMLYVCHTVLKEN